ncbi:class I SAM-dependent methyltransferase [Pararhodobacter sp. SW119]|uniref:class I SAM-dependent methyltransferase n=1 Tax=Pararhodobacter sp. SW119 TaxID=2780075 RepID=UPI001AE0ABCA|nr:class I SAM-dependent methyltransferase [Pararhodobacter sp. SW119]
MSAPLPDPAPRALRLSLAFEGGLALPETGVIAVLHPRAGEDISPLPQDRVRVVTPHAPDHAAFSAQGYACTRDQGPPVADTVPDAAAADPAAAVLVCLPRNREEARDLVARAAAMAAHTGGPVILDGQKTDGIEALLRALRDRVALSEPLSKGHGKIAWFAATDAAALADWRAAQRAVTDESGRRFVTQPGIFSSDGADPGSALLLASLPAGLKGRAVDLGAGWGWLSTGLLAQSPKISELHLVESDARALACARENVADPRAVFHWADATHPLPGLSADLIVSNPPFHQGRAGQPGLGQAFLRAAAAMLAPSGQLWLVANRHLPYEATLAQAFTTHREVAAEAGFKVLLAERPRRATAPQRARRAT